MSPLMIAIPAEIVSMILSLLLTWMYSFLVLPAYSFALYSTVNPSCHLLLLVIDYVIIPALL